MCIREARVLVLNADSWACLEEGQRGSLEGVPGIYLLRRYPFLPCLPLGLCDFAGVDFPLDCSISLRVGQGRWDSPGRHIGTWM